MDQAGDGGPFIFQRRTVIGLAGRFGGDGQRGGVDHISIVDIGNGVIAVNVQIAGKRTLYNSIQNHQYTETHIQGHCHIII